VSVGYDDYYKDDIEAKWRELGAASKVDNIVALGEGVPHGTILEVGAGEGAVLKELSMRGFGRELYALEVSRSGVEAIARKEIPTLIKAELFDGAVIPYEDQSFDLAILCHVVEHLDNPRSLIREALRVARHVVVEVPLEDNCRLRKDYAPDRVGHINHYNARTIRYLLQTCGAEVLAQTTTNAKRAAYEYKYGRSGAFRHFVKGAMLRALPRLATRLWTYNCALVVRKGPWVVYSDDR